MVARPGQRPGVVTTYNSAHERVKRIRGYAAEHNCPCGSPARDWAYVGGDPQALTDPRTGCEFSLSPDYYAPMCRRCHLRMDKAKITQCPHGHEYTPENTWYEKGSRVCRRCKLDRNEVRRRDKLRAAGKAVQPPA